jgi:hypothetical protein
VIVRLTPLPGGDIERLLQMPLGLDIWERGRDPDVAAVNESQISELERRRLANVERLYTVEEFVSAFGYRLGDQPDARDAEQRHEEE